MRMMICRTPLESIQRAVAIYGSQSATARARGVSQAAVWKWVHGKAELPAEQVLAIEVDTGVSKHDLRPDLYPHDLKSHDGPESIETSR